MTAPLLKQIANLQESFRAKTDAFHVTENSLCERALKAEGALDMSEHRRKILEEQAAVVRQELELLNARFLELKANNQSNEVLIDRYKRAEIQYYDLTEELNGKLLAETTQKLALQNSMRDMEVKHKNEFQDLKDSLELASLQHKTEVSKLLSEIEALRRSGASDSLVLSPGDSPQPFPKTSLGSPHQKTPIHVSGAASGRLANGEMSFALNEKAQKILQQKEEELFTLQLQLRQLQMTRDALLSEVSFLSNRNSELELQMKFASSSDLQSSIVNLKKHNALLLSLLGEKEEELEAMVSDMMEVKFLYRDEIDKLINQITSQGAAS
jgi:hypothetical protein